MLATVLVALPVYQLYLNQWLQIRWRSWMTTKYLGEWLHDANHYRMQLQGDAADNPDQRMTDDVKLFVEPDAGHRRRPAELRSSRWRPLSSSCGVCPRQRRCMLFGSDFAIPGYLVWGALIYAIFGTALTQWIGSPLVNLDFNQQRLRRTSASTWCGCAKTPSRSRCCEGEPAERERLSERFGRVVGNWYGIMSRTKRLTAFTQSYAQAAVMIPVSCWSRPPISPTRSSSAR